ncbi:MAG: endonuclease [Glaciihabitans sp.]|nr:endonuclease [Glaciihabitans sp.]
MSDHRTLLAEATVLLARLAELPLPVLGNEELALVLEETEAAGRLLDGVRVTVAAEVADRCRYSLGAEMMCHPFGYTKASHYLEYVTRISSAEASRRILLGAAVLPRVNILGAILPAVEPIVADAVISGDIGTEVAAHLHRLVRKVGRCTPREKLDEVLTILVGEAKRISCDLVAVQVREWIAILDTEGIEPREDSQRRRRAFHLGREATNGMTPFNGQLDPLGAGLIKAIFTDAARSALPRFISDADRAAGTVTSDNDDGTTTTVEDDLRTRPQRQLDIIMGTLNAGLRASADHSGASMRSTVVVSVMVQLADLQKQYDIDNAGVGDGAGFGLAAMRPAGGVGWIDEVGDPISTATIRQLLCDGAFQQVLLGNAGEVLYLSRTHRLFSAAQRRALAVRDGGCVWPNCTVPAAQCDAHHVTEYGQGGETHIDNAVLACSAHHHRLHNSDFTMRMFGGKPYLRQPFWLDPTQTWQPIGHTRGHISAALTAQATLAAFEATAATLTAMAENAPADRAYNDNDIDIATEPDGEPNSGVTYADDIPLWYTPPAIVASSSDATGAADTTDREDPPATIDAPDAPGSLAENIPSFIVTPRRRRPGKSKPAITTSSNGIATPIPSRKVRLASAPAPVVAVAVAVAPGWMQRHEHAGGDLLTQNRSDGRRCGALHGPPGHAMWFPGT